MTLDDGDCELLPVEPESPTPHREKLMKLLSNDSLPKEDKESVQAAIEKYEAWIERMNGLGGEGDEKVKGLVDALNDYLTYIELELIWDSQAPFLFRQRGQLKLGSTILEEFLPRLADPRIIPALEGKNLPRGPRKSFAGAQFVATLEDSPQALEPQIRTKDQDFTVGRSVYLRSSLESTAASNERDPQEVYIALVAAECKTNLDKTMFQEAIATARDLKNAVPGSRYYLLCEWLDMTPISTLPTDIDEVIILRGKRLSATNRKGLNSAENRKARREWSVGFLKEHPVRYENIMRFVKHMRSLFDALRAQEEEEDVIRRGYF